MAEPAKWPNLALDPERPPLGRSEDRGGARWQVQQLVSSCGFNWVGWLPLDGVNGRAGHDATREIVAAHGAETGCAEHTPEKMAEYDRTCAICNPPDVVPKPDPRRPGWIVVDALDNFLDARDDVRGASQRDDEMPSAYRDRCAERAYTARLNLANALEQLVAKTPVNVVFDKLFSDPRG